ncbi:hypothetical protein B9Z55_026047 [Caenorhabditis nigoni]|uniref:T-box domain-containing protein n=2 Tax=Caenorhabditis nigoni TaxID=1611254 RepID=A0A2G5T1U8_9PELO|nr:hypothetical protein B9Z55_026047 [Caenorhabditis nigoni]
MASSVTVTLSPAQDAKWKLFHTQVHEMRVKKSGLNLFPKMEYIVRGLDPIKMYAIMIQMELVDDRRYTYSNEQWVVSGEALYDHRMSKHIWHKDGVRTGTEWMKSQICFDNFKITTDLDTTDATMIPLVTMQKYAPVLTIFEVPSQGQSRIFNQPMVIKIPYTEFIAVSNYYNKTLAHMKKMQNPKCYHKFPKNNEVNGKKRKSSSASGLTDDSTSTSSSPKFPRITPSPGVTQTINLVPATQMLFNPFLFPFNNFFASGMPFPTNPFQFPPITQSTTTKKPFLVENLI